MRSKWGLLEHFLDKRLGFYIAKLSEPESESEHRLQIATGFDACPHCGHVRPKTNLGLIDGRAILAQELASLQQSHDDQDKWAAAMNVPVRKKGRKIR